MFIIRIHFGLGMSESTSLFTFRSVLFMWLCWFPLLLLVEAQDAKTDPVEVKALQDIKSNLIDVNENLKNWNGGDPCKSNWIGVMCFITPLEDGYFHVQELHLFNMNLSGTLSPSLGQLVYLEILDFMWNNISGTIPKETGYLKSLILFHMNNNLISGQIPPELSRLPNLVHLLLDNNNLSGYLPPELSLLPNLLILQLDNNNFDGTLIPDSYGNMSKLLKMSLRNCNLQGPVPDLRRLPNLRYLDLSSNQLNGTLPPRRLVNAVNITTIDLSNNNLVGNVPDNFSGIAHLQKLSFANNSLTGSIPEALWEVHNTYERLILDFENNRFSNVSGSGTISLPANVTLWLQGNPLCSNSNLFQYCGSQNVDLIPNNQSYSNISDIFGPNELLYFTLLDPYRNELPTSPSPSLSPSPSPSYTALSKGSWAGFAVGVISGPIILSVIIYLMVKRMKYRVIIKRFRASKVLMKIDGIKDFSYSEMAFATCNFNNSAIVGQGGYGKVYKGTLADDNVVAIKRAQKNSLQGDKEFLNEIELLSRLHHRNLVALIGYCDEKDEQMLVYEFMPNGTLRDRLSANSEEPLSFAMRLRIALGSAKGILYLHTEANPPIFHRDIKTSNILLDLGFNAKVADFGLSRLAPLPDVEGSMPSYVSTVVKGTPGYLDPEYFRTHKLTDKSDVYSLGVVFLELLTGMRAISHGKNIVQEVNDLYQPGMTFSSFIDARMGSYPSECAERFLNLGIKCCEDKTDMRPSMADVVRELENIWLMMPESKKTGNLPPSSSSVMEHVYILSDVSGDISSITPR